MVINVKVNSCKFLVDSMRIVDMRGRNAIIDLRLQMQWVCCLYALISVNNMSLEFWGLLLLRYIQQKGSLWSEGGSTPPD